MNGDLAFPASPSRGRLRVLPIVGDRMYPSLHPSDVAMVAPADGFSTDGLYALENDGDEQVYRVAAHSDGLLLIGDNPLYGPPQIITSARFADRLTGRVAVACRVLLPDLVGHLAGRDKGL